MKCKWRFLKYLFILFICTFIASCASSNSGSSSYAGKNTGNPQEPTRQTNRVTPQRRDNTRYLDSNKKKKKKWSNIKPSRGGECQWHKQGK